MTGDNRLAWVLLNPSTADAQQDDPTIRRCVGFAQRWGYSGIHVVNLFALRSTDPSQLLLAPDPIGPDNDRYILEAAQSCDKVILGWGNHGSLFGRDVAVVKLLQGANISPYALGVTKSNAPKHPLYIKSDTVPFPYLL